MKIVIFLLMMLMSGFVFAQEDDLNSAVDYKINKMKTELQLTDAQALAIKPVIKNYLTKRSEVLQEVAGQGIVDHVSVKETLKTLKEDEYQKLGKVLNEDQLKKMINKDNLMATLNPDSAESSFDDEPTLGASGANFKF